MAFLSTCPVRELVRNGGCSAFTGLTALLELQSLPHPASCINSSSLTKLKLSAMDKRPKLYAITAFVAGIILTLGYKDFYPDLEWRFWRRRRAHRTIAGAGLDENGGINLEDHETNGVSTVEFSEGIEACIGNTPLFKIKSLSRETGCDILAKAEVRLGTLPASKNLSDGLVVSQWWRRQSERQSSPRHRQYGERNSFP